jgi:general secretion pathway protein K
MVYGMMMRLERDTRRTSLILHATQAQFYAQGSLAWALDQLRNNWEAQTLHQVIDAVPIQSPVQNVNGYKIASTIYDMQARFNLNNLSEEQAQVDFKRLLQIVAPTLSEQQIQTILRALSDWITPVTQQKEDDNYYLHLQPAYRAAHRRMQNISELRLVRGITPTLYNALRPYVAALPETTLINIQTAPVPVLMTLSPTLTVAHARRLQQLRQQTPFTTSAMLLKIAQDNSISEGKITAVSHYFLVVTQVGIENQQLVIYTLVERYNQGRKALLRIVSQSKGIE